MPLFVRNTSARWHTEVPGSRWFRADLHLHTLDDHPNANLRRPAGINGDPSDAATQSAYARAYLKAAVGKGIQILGLTPHAVKCGDSDATCATWQIVDEWNSGVDDDGVPFRDKIYAVFPGFEPSLSDGAAGIHVLFLFDPEIGREQYLQAFQVVMNGVTPYRDGNLTNTTRTAVEVFRHLKEMKERVGGDWKYLCLAPHAFSDKGLFRLRSQVLEQFPHEELVGIELGDNQLPEDARQNRPWLDEGVRRYRHGFFHSSDAYSVDAIGTRFTLLKLGSPRAESLRQAFLASDSRTRLAYRKNGNGEFELSDDLPDPQASGRPWLRRAVIRGGTSFFRKSTGHPEPDIGNTFELSPDLTCVIGGRMSGKSTFLDGLRLRVGVPLPADAATRTDVESRARTRFLSGNATCELDICGPIAHTEQDALRWPAKFFTQRELQDAAKDQTARRRLLYRLVPGQGEELERLDSEITRLDTAISQDATRVIALRASFASAAQDLQGVERAKDALASFRNAGSDSLTTAQGDSGRVVAAIQELATLKDMVTRLSESASSFAIPRLDDQALAALLKEGQPDGVRRTLLRLRAGIRLVRILHGRLVRQVTAIETDARSLVSSRKAEVQKRLVEAGGDAESLNQFDALSVVAADYEARLAALNRARTQYVSALRDFVSKTRERERDVDTRRGLMEELSTAIAQRFNDRIRLVIREHGVPDVLDAWIRGLRNQGVTRWWNDRCKQEPPVSPQSLYRAWRFARHDHGGTPDLPRLQGLGMSAQVAGSFVGAMDDANQTTLASLRSEDRYNIEMRVRDAPAEYREMARLSGGAQVSVLLSLVLEAEDATPLVIDQPEDEIDKESLLATVLPALRRLKGKRQVILATHDANIVVNGDADQVVQLRAEADIGRIEVQGVIEESGVRDAIVNTLDGGQEAFALRQAKYGF